MPVLTPLVWRLIVYGGIALSLIGFGAYEMHAHDARKLKQLQSDFDTFKGGVAALGKAAQKRTDETNAANLKRKKDADADATKANAKLVNLYDAYNRLLNNPGTYRSVLPGTPGAPGSPTVLTFDRAALDRGLEAADGVLQRGAAKILYRGDKAITDLDTARKWANGR